MDKNKLLIILDGWGYANKVENNAIAQADTPIWDNLQKKYLNTLIHTSGRDVGLPKGQMGNSEVGHLNLGAGRVVKQSFTRVDDDISSGMFFHNQVLVSGVDKAVRNNKAIHIIGLLSDGGVHSHFEQIFKMLELVKKQNAIKVYLHIFTDGRDSAPKSAKLYIALLESKLAELGVGRIVTIIGRYYAMDRDNRWDRVEQAYRLIIGEKHTKKALSAKDAVEMAYAENKTDEFIPATLIGDEIKADDEDLFVMMNYRADRVREITQALTQKFDRFANRNFVAKNFICLTEYKEEFNLPTAYPPKTIVNSFGEYVSNLGMTQLRIAETEKYAHVTFFLSGGKEHPYKGEDRVLIPSPEVATYDLKPEMSVFEVTEKLIEAIKSKKYNFIICNFANTDMVGHSGNLEAAIKAVEAVDVCLGKVKNAIENNQGEMIITADHGNAEKMLNTQTNQPHTAHTNNPVPFIFVSNRQATIAQENTGSLSDVAPTLLEMMGLEKPIEMTGKSLLTFN